MNRPIQVFTTTASREEADQIAQQLVARGLAGCVQVSGPISSTYRWQGQLETAQEWLCIIKSDKAHYDRLEVAIRELHSYEVPEILAVDVVAGSQPYLEWLAGQLSAPSEPELD